MGSDRVDGLMDGKDWGEWMRRLVGSFPYIVACLAGSQLIGQASLMLKCIHCAFIIVALSVSLADQVYLARRDLPCLKGSKIMFFPR